LDFNPDLSWEFWSKDRLESRTVRALRNHIEHVQRVSPYYGQALAGVAAADISSLDDFAKLPLTDKRTLVENTDSFLAVGPERIAETIVTSGSTGRPLVFAMTGSDLDRLDLRQSRPAVHRRHGLLSRPDSSGGEHGAHRRAAV
jgi:phenylacetate-coenzyme A ligase PaaK-like adenylate-forming protein